MTHHLQPGVAAISVRIALALLLLVLPGCTRVLGDFTFANGEPSEDAAVTPTPLDATMDREGPLADAGPNLGDARAVPGDDAAVTDAAVEAEAPPALAIKPSVWDYREVVIGTTAAITFDIANQGAGQTGVVAASIDAEDGGASSFAIENNGCVSGVTSEQSCPVTVRFAPLSLGVKRATLTVAAAPGGAVKVELTGTGVAPGALVLDTVRHVFAPTVLYRQSAPAVFTVTNSGDTATSPLSAQVDQTTDFQIVSDSCGGNALAAHATCAASVVFVPGSAGMRTGSLAIVASAGGIARANLSGTGQRPAALALAPANGSSVDFGAVLVGTTRDQTFVLRNAGDESSGVIAATVPTGRFAIVAPATGDCRSGTTVLGGGESCTLRVRFTPAAGGGSESSELTTSASPGGSTSASLRATGQTPATFSLLPAAGSTVNFGVVVVGSPKDQPFVLSNTGQQNSGPLTIPALTGAYQLLEPRDGADDCKPGSSLRGGDGCTLRVRFQPSAAGVAGASLAVSATPGGAGALALTGTGQTGAGLRLSPTSSPPSSTDFGSVVIGVPREQSFTLTNTGQQTTSTITLTALTAPFALVAPAAGECVSGVTVLTGAASCTIRVRFTPAASGSLSATLTANATTGGRATLALTGTGQTAARLTLGAATGSSTSFGTVVVNSGAQQDELFTVTNTGQQAASTLTVSLAGSESFRASFSLPVAGTGECRTGVGGTLLQSGQSCAVRVRFRPTVGSALTGQLTVTATNGGTASINLTGSGQNPAFLSLAAATGSSPDFGDVVIGTTREQAFTLTNAGQQPSTAITINSSASNFRLLPPTAGECVSGTTILGPLASCTLRVSFAPTSAGSVSVTLTARATTGGSGTLGLMGAGRTILAWSAIAPSVTDFGTVMVGQTVTQSYRLTNTSDGVQAVTATPLVITITGQAAPFALGATTCGTGLAAGASCDVAVSFTPTAAGSFTRVLQASAAVGGTVSLTVKGASL